MRICAIGDYDSICGFAALGIDIFEALRKEEIEDLIEKAEEREYAVILITEKAAMEATERIDKYKTSMLPAIIPIPNINENGNIGMEGLRKSVEKAAGSAEAVFGK